jgi:cation transport ATPase
MSTGMEIAMESADMTLMNGSLEKLAFTHHLSGATIRNIRSNLFWAFIYNVIGIPIAAGVFVGLGIYLNPMVAAAAMAFSSLSVVLNSMRLRFVS